MPSFSACVDCNSISTVHRIGRMAWLWRSYICMWVFNCTETVRNSLWDWWFLQLQIYEDKDGARKEEIAALKGDGDVMACVPAPAYFSPTNIVFALRDFYQNVL